LVDRWHAWQRYRQFQFLQSGDAIDSRGVLGGITGGYNWQNGPIVIGLEGDVLGADISGS
jgi:hypothetical protein